MLSILKISILGILLTASDSSAQWAFHQYDISKAKATLEKEIFKDHFWTQPSDSRDQSYFRTKSDFKNSGKVKTIPVLTLSKRFTEYDYTKDIRDYYVIDQSLFCGLIYKGDKFLNIMFVTYAYNQKEKLTPVASLGDTPKKFHEMYQQKWNRFFYDTIIQSFCFFEDEALYAWSNEREEFVSYREIIENEKFGLDTFRKSVGGK
jgi:hypothetical protein